MATAFSFSEGSLCFCFKAGMSPFQAQNWGRKPGPALLLLVGVSPQHCHHRNVASGHLCALAKLDEFPALWP